jgi:guanylate kinase
MRDGEIEGIHYHFVSKEEFKKDVEADEFLEYAVVHGNYYGTSLKPVKEALLVGKLVLFDIDVQGNTAVNSRLGDITTSVFITPPTLSELKKRLKNRSTDSDEVMQNRLKMAKREIQRISEYDYMIINDDIDVAAQTLKLIAKAARMKIPSEEINSFIQEWEDIDQ